MATNTAYTRGDNLDFLETDIVHPSHTSGRTASGDAVVIGRFAGIAMTTATAATDRTAVCLKGVFNVPVVATAPVSVGETVYIHQTTAVVSSDLSQVPFGTALDVAASGTVTIRVRLFGHTPGAIGAGS